MNTNPRKIPHEQRVAEGKFITQKMNEAKAIDKSITVEYIAGELGITQGLVSQWRTGRSPIPDESLLWLSGKLNFDPISLRPSLSKYLSVDASGKHRGEIIRDIVLRLATCNDDQFDKARSMFDLLLPPKNIQQGRIE